MKKTKLVLIFSLMTILLTLGFYRNQWQAAGRKWFYDWKNNSDVMLVARLAWSRQKGLLANGALLGLGDGQWPMTQELGVHQYDTYLNNGNFSTYWTYNSVPGTQGLIFGFFDQTTNLNPGLNLKIFRGLTALLSSMSIAALLIWIWIEVGSIPAIFALAFCLFSEWMTLYGGSIYWQFWAFYVPLIGMTLYIKAKKQYENISTVRLIEIGAAATLIKILFNGFEFITPTIGMIFVPVFYYSISRKWTFKSFLQLSFKAATGSGLGILAGLAILICQVASVSGGLKNGIQYIAYTYEKRAFGNPDQYTGTISESLKANTFSVVWKYVSEGRAINLGNWIHNDYPHLKNALEIQYYEIFIVFFLMTIIFILFRKNSFYRENLPFLYTTWISFFPPLSWLILFKAHSYIHTNLDYIIWQMPFTIFGFALCGIVIQGIWSLHHRLIKSQ
jgi:hypothetical protein